MYAAVQLVRIASHSSARRPQFSYLPPAPPAARARARARAGRAPPPRK